MQFEEDAEPFLSMLSPNGVIFNSILQQMNNPNVVFHFPWTHLPPPVIALLDKHALDQLPILFKRPSVPGDRLVLNAFDFYMFSFFFHGTVPRMGRRQDSSLDDYGKKLKKVYSTSVNGIVGWDFKPQRLSAAMRENKKDLYLELFRRYIDFFCPPNGSPSPAASMTVYSASNPPSTTITSSGGVTNTGTSAISQLNIRFLATMNEFWLNQNPLPSKTKKEIPVSVTYTCPTRQVVIGIQVLIQRLISNYSASPSLFFTQELLLIQKSLYWFLRLAFAHWPLATPIYPVVDFWLAYLSLKKLPSQSEAEFRSKRKVFIVGNLYFYVNLFSEFLRFANRQFSFERNEGRLQMARIAHFYNEELIQIVQEAERLYFQQGRSDYSNLVAIGQSLEESPFVYQSLLAVPTLKQVRQVVLKLKSALDGITSQRPRDSFLDRVSDFIRPPTNYSDILSEIIDSFTNNFRLQRLEEILREDSSLSQLSGPTTDYPLPLGPRRISKLAIKSEVPPMLRPITSFENTSMVRILHRLSLFLEEKIYGTLPLPSSSSSFPPHLEGIEDEEFEREVGVSTPRRRTGEETEEEDYSTTSIPSTILTSNRGEINLRFLADYRFQASFLALYLLLSLLWRLVVSPEENF